MPTPAQIQEANDAIDRYNEVIIFLVQKEKMEGLTLLEAIDLLHLNSLKNHNVAALKIPAGFIARAGKIYRGELSRHDIREGCADRTDTNDFFTELQDIFLKKQKLGAIHEFKCVEDTLHQYKEKKLSIGVENYDGVVSALNNAKKIYFTQRAGANNLLCLLTGVIIGVGLGELPRKARCGLLFGICVGTYAILPQEKIVYEIGKSVCSFSSYLFNDINRASEVKPQADESVGVVKPQGTV